MMSVIRKNLLKRLPIMLMVILLALVIAPAMVSADDEESALQNPAQAQKAENVAYAAALNSEDDALAQSVTDLEKAEQELADAVEALANLPDDATDEKKDEAIQDVANKTDAKELAEQDVASNLSRVSGELEADITNMRIEDGLGWGQICHELGVHPSVLGNKYGHMNTHQNKHQFGKKGDMSAATTRDVKTGWARGHGKSVSGKSNGKGKADSFGVDNSGKAKGKSNGNSGGGKGGGKGGGNGKK